MSCGVELGADSQPCVESGWGLWERKLWRAVLSHHKGPREEPCFVLRRFELWFSLPQNEVGFGSQNIYVAKTGFDVFFNFI